MKVVLGYVELGFMFNLVCDPIQLENVTVLIKRFCEAWSIEWRLRHFWLILDLLFGRYIYTHIFVSKLGFDVLMCCTTLYFFSLT